MNQNVDYAEGLRANEAFEAGLMTRPGWKVTAWTPAGPVVAWACWLADQFKLIGPSERIPRGVSKYSREMTCWRADSHMRPDWPRVLNGQILGLTQRDALEGPFTEEYFHFGARRSQEFADAEPIVLSLFAEAARDATMLVYNPPAYGFPTPKQLEEYGADICDLKGNRRGATWGDDQFAVLVDGRSAFYSSSNSLCDWNSYWISHQPPTCGADVADYLNALRTLTRRDEPAEVC